MVKAAVLGARLLYSLARRERPGTSDRPAPPIAWPLQPQPTHVADFLLSRRVPTTHLQVGPSADAFFKRAQHVFKALYDADLLPEEALLAWHAAPPTAEEEESRDADGGGGGGGGRPGAPGGQAVSAAEGARVREAVAPFIAWLQEAEEDSDE